MNVVVCSAPRFVGVVHFGHMLVPQVDSSHIVEMVVSVCIYWAFAVWSKQGRNNYKN